MSQQIDYKDIIDLGFDEQIQNDSVYQNKYGYSYSIITKKLTETIFLDWTKETRLCKIVRIDNKDEQNIMAELPIENYNQLIKIINFFTKNKTK